MNKRPINNHWLDNQTRERIQYWLARKRITRADMACVAGVTESRFDRWLDLTSGIPQAAFEAVLDRLEIAF